MAAWWGLYIFVLLVGLVSGAVACGAARRLGVRWQLLDHPKGRKAHARPVALTGGWGIYAGFVALLAGGLLLAPALARALETSQPTLSLYLGNIAGVRPQLFAVLLGLTMVFLLGLIDDLRPLGPRIKMAGQIIAIVPLLVVGISIKGYLPVPIGWALTAFWILTLTNSFNLLDNMDGLSASVATMACLVMSLAAWQGGELWLPALFLAFAGVLMGFLCFNFHPASMFMGDSGALTIGYLMGVFSILITYADHVRPEVAPVTGLPILMPLVIMGVPLFDTLSVIYIRWRNGKPLMVGDRNHFSHRLLAMGFGVRATALTIAALTLGTGLMALPLRRLGLGAALVHLLGVVAIFGVIVALECVGRRPSQS